MIRCTIPGYWPGWPHTTRSLRTRGKVPKTHTNRQFFPFPRSCIDICTDSYNKSTRRWTLYQCPEERFGFRYCLWIACCQGTWECKDYTVCSLARWLLQVGLQWGWFWIFLWPYCRSWGGEEECIFWDGHCYAGAGVGSLTDRQQHVR